MRCRHRDDGRDIGRRKEGYTHYSPHRVTYYDHLRTGRVVCKNISYRTRRVGNLRVECGAMESGQVLVEFDYAQTRVNARGRSTGETHKLTRIKVERLRVLPRERLGDNIWRFVELPGRRRRDRSHLVGGSSIAWDEQHRHTVCLGFSFVGWALHTSNSVITHRRPFPSHFSIKPETIALSERRPGRIKFRLKNV